MLPAGVFVHVVELQHLPGSGRLRGRIEHPPGWISLLDTTTGYRWAEPYGRAGAVTTAAVSGRGRAMGLQLAELNGLTAPAVQGTMGSMDQRASLADRDVLFC